MRISTSQLYDQNIRAIMDNQREMTKTQEALSSGKQINRPSDDPVGAAKVVRLTEELDKLTQYQRNNDLLTSGLEQQEAVLDNINDTVTRARTLIVQAGSGVMADTDRRAIGVELAQIRDEVLGLMNAQNANGDYIFAGYQSQNQAFTFNAAASDKNVTFTGDGGQNEVKLSDSVSVRSTASGQEVFDNVLARRNFSVNPSGTATVASAKVEQQGTFDTFSKANYDPVTAGNNNYQLEILASGQVQLSNTASGSVVDTVDFTADEPFTIKGMTFTLAGGAGDTVDFSLDPPQKTSLAETLHDISRLLMDSSSNSQNIDEAISDALVGLDNGLEKVALERSSIGGRLNTAESVYETNLDLEIATKSARSAIEDTDYAEASAEFAKQETALNAALATFPKVSNLSLFNYI
ncbi:flagellar hook-associated protein FlgL [Salinimonas sediminis]|uniref:Flagellar hook-associated protein 3 n=1 Tax=Salinimonas sediminis TaxID=2303538 RepID=A0A346NJK2_9ALTE|nr:flagellar hook-associated protein FlgL [Salinimonas sediminis]AXR05709.1 flagellar hook-associated protein 3 [Salinimonas sediminis]